MAKFRKIGILTSGGDAPGMNACFRAVVRKALHEGVQTMGIYEGYNGLIHNEMVELTSDKVRNISHLGGTKLYSSRCPQFATEDGMNKAIENCKKNEIDAVIALGGDGTFRGALDLTAHGIPSIGLPCTIDNDITATDYSIGFDTAMNTTISMIDNLRDTCESHNRCNIIEVMGRNCGQIALLSGIATGAVAIAIPEVPFNEKDFMQRIIDLRNAGRRSMLVVVSEGCFKNDGKKLGEVLEAKLNAETSIETRFFRPAHTVRGGSPTLRDRLIATQMGYCAVDELLKGHSNVVICQVNNQIKPIEINFALCVDRMYKNKLKPNDLDSFSKDQIEDMKKIKQLRTSYIENLYQCACETADKA